MSLSIQVAAKTDVGVVRTNNEDNFGYDVRHGIFILSDGMGGQAAGELASKIAVETVLAYFRRDKRRFDARTVGDGGFDDVSERANALGNAIQLANKAIHDAAAQDAGHHGMGCTIVASVIEGNLFSVAHVGDSRIYLVRRGTMQQLTMDHSLVMEQARRGLITFEEAEKADAQNVIVRALGADETVEPDLADMSLEMDDRLLLCSDGLSRYVSDKSMLDVILRNEDLALACEELIEAAKAGGSDDNITCVLLRAVEQSWGGRLMDRVSGRERQSST